MLTIERKDRLAPLALEKALELADAEEAALLVNGRSGRAAVRLRARSVVDDDGNVHRRFRLIRPMETIKIFTDQFFTCHWNDVDAETFTAAWNAELAELPEYETGTLHMVAGLLLPIWKSLPNESTRVYRLQTNAGERVIGRRVSPAWVSRFVDDGPPKLSADGAWALVMAGDAVLHLAEGQRLARVRAMNDWRVELTGFTDLGVARLKAMGLISEIVSWKLKLYVPAGAAGAEAFARLVDRFPIQRVADRKAA